MRRTVRCAAFDCRRRIVASLYGLSRARSAQAVRTLSGYRQWCFTRRAVAFVSTTEASQVIAVTCTLICFGLLYVFCMPIELQSFAVLFQYPRFVRPSFALDEAIANGNGCSSGSSSTGNVYARKDIDAFDIRAGAQAACANVSTITKGGQFPATHVEINLVVPPLPYSLITWPAICTLDLRDPTDQDLITVHRPVLLPYYHWSVRLWSGILRGPFVAMGLVASERDEVILEMLDVSQLSPHTVASIRSAQICIRPAIPIYHAELRYRVQPIGPLRVAQAHPALLGVALISMVGLAMWLAAGGLHSQSPLATHAETAAAAARKKAFTTHVDRHGGQLDRHTLTVETANDSASSSDDVDTFQRESSPLPCEARPRRPSFATEETPFSLARDVARTALDHARMKLTSAVQDLRCAAADLATSARAAWGHQHVRSSVAAASGGGLVIGAGGGATGLLAGGILGTAFGVVPAFFTFGLSIPIGAAIGSGAGACVGTVVGGTIGFLGGGAISYGVHSQQEGQSLVRYSFRTVSSPAPVTYPAIYERSSRIISGTGSTI